MAVDADISLLDKWRNESSKRFVPLQASLELTYRCNERCTHCYIEKFMDDPKRTLKKEHWFNILHELRKAGSLYVILMGGEAMLNPFFWDISNRANQLGFHVSMITNGLKIQTPEVAVRLKEVGVKVATFSLYSMDPEIHDKMTSVKWSHERTLKAIELCREAGIEVGINCLLTKENIDGFFDLADWCIEKDLEIKEDPFVTPKHNGDVSTTLLRASDAQLVWYFKERARRWKAGLVEPQQELPEDYVCNVAKGKCAINPYGELLPCVEVRESLGNLAYEPFEKLWFNDVATKWRETKIKDLEGRNERSCGTGSFCEHCPGMALHEHGKSMSVTDESNRLSLIKDHVYQQLRS